ncbi:phage integrase [Methylotuvimicrobium alcaliphilum]|uniref:Integrase n=1 Tax=Methylotuvimicrobium alcaliphilum (strain DSM 19304 / NCIMB 14124 / VKM B-2133 / 20Z) TaxID=1091494 RepID=G4SYY4_META2|nr:tyrosine-type recombinase/integrase [Methylotuvimicrobium alcaliphilum]CCE25441.1 Integrase [Methylotuvimicrobium alcaliphilum 20Z]
MAIKKTESGWLADIQPGGRGGKRFRKNFKTKAEALRWEAHVKTKIIKNPDWEPDKKDFRRLSDLMRFWHDHHGKSLKAEKNTFGRLLLVCERLGDPYGHQVTPEMLSEYRTARLAEGITPNGVNREIAYVRSAFNELIRLGQWNKENPAAKLRQFKIDEQELSYLTTEQIKELFIELEKSNSRDILLVASLCLATGARWSEAIGITKRNIRNNAVSFNGTKSGKSRCVPIPEGLTKRLIDHGSGLDDDSALFCNCIEAFKFAIERTSIILPKGQSSHVLRHSFASHFMMNGGNILTLQKILGHQSLTMTMRYAHLSPDHLEKARELSPFAKIF